MLAQRNARLRSVGAGTSARLEDFDDGPEAGAAKWSGNVGVYYRERRRVETGERRAVIVERDVFVSPTELRIEFAEGDTVELELDAARGPRPTVSGTVQDVVSARLPGIGAQTRLVLEPT